METKNENLLNIKLKDKEIENFKSIIKKCEVEDKKIGFQQIFDENEIKLIKDIGKSVNK